VTGAPRSARVVREWRVVSAGSSKATLTYKRGIPTLHDHVPRPALLARLEAATRRAPITWVAGLPGSGKTSLVARWIEEAKRPCLWYRLDEHDADLAQLFHALACSASRALPVWSPEHQADLADFARAFFAELAREPVTIVLDDCHRI